MPPLFPHTFGPPAFVLDVAVPLRWLVVSQGNAYSSGVLTRMSSNTVAVPASWPALFAERIRAEEIAGFISTTKTDRFLNSFRSFSVLVDSAGDEHVWDEALRHARTFSLPVAEAQLLDLALRLNLPLATDETWRSVAATALGIPILRP